MVLIVAQQTRQHQFLLALTAANPGAINPDPASVKADLALGLTPPPAPPPVMPLMAVAADHGRFFLQKLLKRLDPSDQAELVKAALNFLESHGHGRPFVRHRGCIQGYRGSRCSHIFLHGVAPLREWNTPSLPAQGEQRPPPICNIDRDIPGPATPVVATINSLARVLTLSTATPATCPATLVAATTAWRAPTLMNSNRSSATPIA